MTRTITAGLDGSAESLAAAGWAAREALLRNLPLKLVHVWEWQPYTRPPLGVPAFRPPREEYLSAEAVADLRRRHPALETVTERIAGQPVDILPRAAKDAELLVLGSRGLGSVAGFLLGSVALATVARAERPVVLVRAGADAADDHLPDEDGLPSTTTPARDVVLGLDLSRPCEELLEFAFDAASRRAATLRVIHGWSLPVFYGYNLQAADPAQQAELEAQEARALTDVLRPWRSKFPDVPVTEQAVIGRPAQHLVEAATEAGLVVVGRRIRRAPFGTHIGPVTHAVLHHAYAPVAVVPHD
ncbi:universal stress protein [Streptomyces sp. ACA25]|uniref:universal stress protein n=1 Tax=Streptomyces sp. ACA25 TaxID=3022596 RepID=UPI00230733C7|nr:universal stress protein [Streptomyces sp. ACA25]MDB1087296.1 universal stress protein [Streptomyces sp. ACA25]